MRRLQGSPFAAPLPWEGLVRFAQKAVDDLRGPEDGAEAVALMGTASRLAATPK